jgi:uncharacterized protein
MRAPHLALVGLLVGVALTWATPAQAAPAGFGVVTQHDVSIAMSDGVALSANVYRPADPATGVPATGRFPVLLTITPYGKSTGETDPATAAIGMGLVPSLVGAGYVQVVVDVRGTGGSGGAWSFEQPRESVDAAALVGWAAVQPYSTGAVGMLGASYGGISQLLAAGRIGPGSALKAIMPIIPGDDMYRDVMAPGGVPNPLTAAIYAGGNTLGSEAHAVQDGLATGDVPGLVTRVLGHLDGLGVLPVTDLLTGGPASYDSSFWADQRVHDVLGGVVANHVPAMVMGGWRDAFQRGEPLIYTGLQNAAAGRPVDAPMTATQHVTPDYQLVQGPWYHATLGEQGSTPLLDVPAVARAWFDHWLKGADTALTSTSTPFHSYDVTAHTWRATTAYPFVGATAARLYPDEDGTLATAPPPAGTDTVTWSPAPLCTPSTSQFVLLGNDQHAAESNGLPGAPCNADDRGAQLPPGAAVYTTAPLAQAQTIAGPISAHIAATVSSADSEWVVRLEDIAPDGTSLPLTRGVLLGSQRALDPARTWHNDDGSIAMPYHPLTAAARSGVAPGATAAYDVEVFPTHATIAAGHRLRVTIGTGDAPAAVPTPAQTVTLLGGDYRIRRGGTDPTYVAVPFVRGPVGTACADPLTCPAAR